MNKPQHRTPGAYAAEYGFPTDPFELPPADVMARVVEGLQGLNSEPSQRRTGNSEGDRPHDPRHEEVGK
ncbi:hypothetical protein [Nocardia sp. CNY236]|uniref:hypothetical protein n=1 Tax=Nocardia sp. CNY236 TaxID=1169152 RepID=UPI00048B8AFC|nr:hypothetical protein [Nocardia sp. CNY236]